MQDLINKLLIIRCPGIGPARYNDLVTRFDGDVAAAARTLNTPSTHYDNIMREVERANESGIHYICDDDDLYPAALRRIKNHPPIITARGNLETLLRPVVAMVGTRHATAAGMEFMANIANAFASHGVAVASGMAIGTDTAAHRGALRADNDSATIAVLAGGVDYIWPIENESLYWDIVARGVIISEMPVGFVPVATNFVQRNRWVAGIADKLILGEADMKSGSMATARFAIEYGRDIFAIPSHPSDARAAGPNSLISDGLARLCDGVGCFFDDAPTTSVKSKNRKPENLSDDILDKLGTIPISESVLAQIVKKTVSEIKTHLVVLELQGLVRKTDGGYVRV